MFLASGCLPHLLTPQDYWCPDNYRGEREAFLQSAWHLVGTKPELSRPGDFLTLEIMGVPIQVRNFKGTLRALSNVCAHRHCLLTSSSRGNSETMRCQYHGWEYGSCGRTRTIPKPENFVPFPNTKPQLPVYRLETVGQLVFVSLSPEGESLAEHLGPFHSFCQERFGGGWDRTWSWSPDYEANWKVPVENSLEAYHVPSVHPATFKVDPGEDRSTHHIEPGYTWFSADLPFSHTPLDELVQRFEDRWAQQLGQLPSGRYSQHHVFPNLLFSFTDTLSFCQCIIPTGPQSCRAVVRQFGPKPSSLPFSRRGLLHVWNRLKAEISRQILKEDKNLFAAVQKGLESSPHQGMLGRCEERLYAFQREVKERLEMVAGDR